MWGRCGKMGSGQGRWGHAGRCGQSQKSQKGQSKGVSFGQNGPRLLFQNWKVIYDGFPHDTQVHRKITVG